MNRTATRFIIGGCLVGGAVLFLTLGWFLRGVVTTSPPSIVVPQKDDYDCLEGLFDVQTSFTPGFGGNMIIGEQLLCGYDLHTSNIYGPTMEEWLARGVHFNPFIGEDDQSTPDHE